MNGRRLDVQGLRALAILIVVAYTGRLGLTGGSAGVDAFVVVSGYVITLTLLADLDRTGRLSFPAFFVRRAIAPNARFA